MKGQRPDPDRILESISGPLRVRGRLKIFFGMSAGVGKTYSMLKEAQALTAQGQRVVIGWLESHGRKETDDLATGLPFIPALELDYKGIRLSEMDLAAVIESRPDLVLVDELAHTNAPGLKHPKRFNDIEEILNAGINVSTTVNIQHLESIAEVVEDLAGVRVVERIPDSIFDVADDVQFIDVSPDELIKRLNEGKVYIGEKSRDAVNNFFRKENLAMLRELALRQATQLASHQLTNILRGENRFLSSSDTRKIVVAVSPSPNSEYLIRWTRRFAYALKATWTCLNIETGRFMAESEKSALSRYLTLARSLGALVVTLPREDAVSGILEYCQNEGISMIITGKSNTGFSFFSLLFRKRMSSISSRLIRESGKISVVAVQEKEKIVGRTKSAERSTGHFDFRKLALPAVAIFLATCVNIFLSTYLNYWAVAIIYLAVISFLSYFVERWPLMIAAMFSALLWNFLFIPPLYTFSIHRFEDALMFIFYFVLATTSSWMTSKVKKNEAMLKIREKRMMTMNVLSNALESINGTEQTIILSNQHLSSAFLSEVITVLKNEEADVLTKNPVGSKELLDEKEYAAASYCFMQGTATGRFTDTLPNIRYHFVPMVAPGSVIGVVGIRLDNQAAWPMDHESFLLTMVSTMSLAVQREILYERNIKNSLIRESERLGRILLNSVSHELRTPLTVIQGSASALLDSETAEDGFARNGLVNEILTGTERLNNIIENLLSMNRLESGHVKLKISLADPVDLVSSALKTVKNELGTRSVKVTRPEHVPLIPCDDLLIMQVLGNLLQNAARYSPEGSAIEVSLAVSAECAIFTVQDNGYGVNEEDLPRLFEKFFRSKSNQNTGLGLGLSICKAIIEVHGGTILARNVPIGRGLVIEFSLPIQKTMPSSQGVKS